MKGIIEEVAELNKEAFSGKGPKKETASLRCSEEFLEDLIKQYGKLVFSICYQFTNNYFDAEDLAQDTFLSAYRNYESFQGEHQKAWISKIAANKCLDYLKKASAKTFPTEDSFFKELPSKERTPEEMTLEEDTRQYLKKLCHSLGPPYDQVATDYFYHQLSSFEIAQKENKSIKTIQTQLYRAKGMMRKLWRKE